MGTDPNVQVVSGNVANVTLVAYTHAAEKMTALVSRTYEGVLSTYCSEEEQAEALREIQKTPLGSPLEMVHYAFLVKDVTRAFTHQMVRTRVGASYAQESLRFAVKSKAKVLATGAAKDFPAYEYAARQAIRSYHRMLEVGIPTEDARGILPTNILTSIFVDYSLRTLINVYRQRMCCQAQPGEWQHVLSEMKSLIQCVHPAMAQMLKAPGEYPGSCGYRSKWDRPCSYHKHS